MTRFRLIGRKGACGGPTDAAARALFDYGVAANSALERACINNALSAIRSAGYLASLDRLYVFAPGAQADSLVNWVDPAVGLLTINGAPTFTPNRGWTGASTSNWLGSGFNPATAVSPKFAQNSMSLFSYANGADLTPTSGNPDVGNTNAFIRRRTVSNNFAGRSNRTTSTSAYPTSGTMSSGLGYRAIDRIASNEATGYWNLTPGAPLSSQLRTEASSGVSNDEFTILKVTASLDASQYRVAFCGWGQSLGAAGHAAVMRAMVNGYLAPLGAA